MPEGLLIHVRYVGTAVADGTMPISDVLSALDGFYGAYSKVASVEGEGLRHELRLAGIKKESFELIVVAGITTVAGGLQNIETIAGAARWVFSQIAAVIGAKKHTRGEPYAVSVNGDGNTVLVVNGEGVSLPLSRSAFEIFQARTLDRDLNKIADPLHPNFVDSVQLRADGEGETIEQTITAQERESFLPPESTTTSKETEIIGTLVSLNKENNRGSFRLRGGKNIRYRYTGDNEGEFHADFALKGEVKVKCVAHFDENLEPTQIEILSVARVQLHLPLPE